VYNGVNDLLSFLKGSGSYLRVYLRFEIFRVLVLAI